MMRLPITIVNAAIYRDFQQYSIKIRLIQLILPDIIQADIKKKLYAEDKISHQ